MGDDESILHGGGSFGQISRIAVRATAVPVVHGSGEQPYQVDGELLRALEELGL